MLSKLNMKQRMYLQFTLAILPLAFLLLYQTLSVSDLPARVNSDLAVFHDSLSALSSYKEFLNGVNDAVDTGKFSSKTITSLDEAQIITSKLLKSSNDSNVTAANDTMQKVQAAIAAKNSIEVLIPLTEEIHKVDSALAQLANEKEKHLGTMVEDDGTASAKKNQIFMLVSLITMMILGFIIRHMVNGVIVPINWAVKAAKRVASGDLSTSAPTTFKYNEMSELQQALNDMTDSLIAVVSRVRNGSDAIASAAEQVAAGNMDLSARTEQQASSLVETATSMKELTDTVKKNSVSANEANDMANSAEQIAFKGGDVVAQVVETMNSIDTSSKKIVDIISVIDGIAFQTNILALNAAVEAARAGEQGRGFAVVATEVRSLAQRSAAAAREVKVLITDSVEKVEIGSKLVAQAGSTMEQIVASVRNVTHIMGQITSASSEQSMGIEQVNIAISQMEEVTQQNAALVEEAAAAAESMHDQASSLVDVVSVFTVNKRIDPRFELHTPARITQPGLSTLNGTAIDVSISGLCILMQNTFPADQRCEVSFRLPGVNSATDITVTAHSVYCVQSGHEGYMVGMRFSSELTSAIAAQLAQYIETASPV